MSKKNGLINHFKRGLLTLWLVGCLVSLQAVSREPLTLYREGAAFLAAEDYFQAVQSFKEALELNPVFLEPHIGLAESFYKLGELEEALTYIAAGKKLDKNNIRLLNLEGYIQIARHDFKTATGLFTLVLAREPNNLEARFGLAEVDLADGKKQQAASRYLAALQVSPDNKMALIHLIEVNYELGENQVAEKYLELALKQHADDPQIHFMAGQHYFRLKNYPLAEKYLTTALALKPKYFQAWQVNGLVQMYRGNYSAGITSLEASLPLGDEFSRSLSYYSIGIAYQKTGRHQEAIANFRLALGLRYDDEVSRLAAENLALGSLTDKDPIRVELAKHHFRQAENFRELNYLSKAMISYRRCLQLNPDHREARIQHANLYKIYGFPVKYYYALKVLKDYYGFKDQALLDELDIYKEFLYETVAARWNKTLNALYTGGGEDIIFNQFSIEKTKYNFSLFTLPEANRLIHPLADQILTDYFRQLFLGNEIITAEPYNPLIASRGEAFKSAKNDASDFFLILTFDEQERSFEVTCELYLSRTGSLLKSFKLYRTGNNKLESAFYALTGNIYEQLPLKGKLLTRNFSQGLINLGRIQGVKTGDIFQIVKKNRLQLDHVEIKYNIQPDDLLGEFEITAVDENLAEGKIKKKNFFDYINPGDDLLLLPKTTGNDTTTG